MARVIPLAAGFLGILWSLQEHFKAAPGGNDLLNADGETDTSYGVEGLPADGRLLYVRLFSLFGGAWYSNDYVYGAPQY